MLSDRAKALRPMIQAAYDAGGLDGVCKAVAGLIAPLEVCVEQLMARVAELEKRLNMNRSNSSNLITDVWGSSDTLEKCDHSRCNAHLLRELTSFSEDGHRWAEGLIDALLAMKQADAEARQQGKTHIPSATIDPQLPLHHPQPRPQPDELHQIRIR